MTAVTSGRHQDLCSAGKLRNLNYCNHKVGSREFLILILENQKVKTRTLRCKMTTAAANQAKSTGMIMLQKINWNSHRRSKNILVKTAHDIKSAMQTSSRAHTIIHIQVSNYRRIRRHILLARANILSWHMKPQCRELFLKTNQKNSKFPLRRKKFLSLRTMRK